ncbi:hypothetical protein IHE44_0006730 [Lamprotornis superbus]|uniref:Secreted protein n=1 Tax=Lamprotornis superbus TaxID=245042 RepID=A0A835TLN3_9PASS|nr:hypothetical protein IHE44_0006730 [Lamprotornis superbus]
MELPLLGFLQLVLDLAELGQVDIGQLLLCGERESGVRSTGQLVHQILQPEDVLPVFLRLERLTSSLSIKVIDHALVLFFLGLNLTQLVFQCAAHLLQLLLHTLQVVDLLPQLSCAVRVLLAQGGSRGFVLQRGLFQHEHVVIEELLQFLIGEVDAQLLKAIKLPGIKRHTMLSRISDNTKVSVWNFKLSSHIAGGFITQKDGVFPAPDSPLPKAREKQRVRGQAGGALAPDSPAGTRTGARNLHFPPQIDDFKSSSKEIKDSPVSMD